MKICIIQGPFKPIPDVAGGAVEKRWYKLALEFVKKGHKVFYISKKFKRKSNLYNWTISRIPQKRWGNPEEVSNLICFLLSDLSNYVNGTSINIDGGWTGS